MQLFKWKIHTAVSFPSTACVQQSVPLKQLLVCLRVRRFHQEGSLLVHDNATEVDINSARFEYIWQVGRFDLFEGMNHADQVSRRPVRQGVTVLVGPTQPGCWDT